MPLSPLGISTMIASFKAFGKYPVDKNALYMLVISCIMFGVVCCSSCALILLAPGTFFFLRLVILDLTYSAITGTVGRFFQSSLLNFIPSSFETLQSVVLYVY